MLKVQHKHAKDYYKLEGLLYNKLLFLFIEATKRFFRKLLQLTVHLMQLMTLLVVHRSNFFLLFNSISYIE